MADLAASTTSALSVDKVVAGVVSKEDVHQKGKNQHVVFKEGCADDEER